MDHSGIPQGMRLKAIQCNMHDDSNRAYVRLLRRGRHGHSCIGVCSVMMSPEMDHSVHRPPSSAQTS